jgi:phosphoribosylaminoimidazole-succinocarboxamide synthase
MTETDLPFSLIKTGKVRSIYELPGSPDLLFVATDRVSCFDVVLKTGIPDKGCILTLMSAHCFSLLKEWMPSLRTHFVSLDLPESVEDPNLILRYSHRSMQVISLDILPLESIVRGDLTGSAYDEYQRSRTIHGIPLPEGLKESEKLEQPLWTPSTKAEQGDKDENISPSKAEEIVGSDIARRVQQLSLKIYSKAAEYALERGIVIADSKFEFGIDHASNSIVLVDEVLTPDSSRFWPAASYEVGRPQKSLDKQYLRDWLISSSLKGKEVEVPPDVVNRTTECYREAFQRLIERSWDDFIKHEEKQ